MGSKSMALRLRIERRRPPLPRFFSSSAHDGNGNDRDPQTSSISSHFSDVKATLKHQPSGDHPLRRTMPRPSFLNRPQQNQPQNTPEFLSGIQKRLSQFRSRDTPPPSGPSFQKLYQPNGSTDSPRKAAQVSLDGIKESLKGIRRPNTSSLSGDKVGSSSGDHMSLSRLMDYLSLKPEKGNAAAPPKVAGEVGKGVGLPRNIFGKEMQEKEEKSGKQKEKQNWEKTLFSKSYAYDELGEKLRMLRSPADEGMKGFSLKELNERLIKLKEMEEKEIDSKSKTGTYGIIRTSLLSVNMADKEKEMTNTSKWAYLPGYVSRMALVS